MYDKVFRILKDILIIPLSDSAYSKQPQRKLESRVGFGRASNGNGQGCRNVGLTKCQTDRESDTDRQTDRQTNWQIHKQSTVDHNKIIFFFFPT